MTRGPLQSRMTVRRRSLMLCDRCSHQQSENGYEITEPPNARLCILQCEQEPSSLTEQENFVQYLERHTGCIGKETHQE